MSTNVHPNSNGGHEGNMLHQRRISARRGKAVACSVAPLEYATPPRTDAPFSMIPDDEMRSELCLEEAETVCVDVWSHNSEKQAIVFHLRTFLSPAKVFYHNARKDE